MSRIYDALRRTERERRSTSNVEPEPTHPIEFLQGVILEPATLLGVPSVSVDVTPESRVVALTDPQGLGAEKFRALATRLENMRKQRELKSFQVSSGLPSEGKSLVTANLAITFAQHSGAKVLLVEGDLRKPNLGMLLGLSNLRGLGHWWAAQDESISTCLYRFGRMPLWFLPAGKSLDQSSSILQSARFAEALRGLVDTFDWIIVDSTPLLPFVDTNLWSRLLDGMLLVAREGMASVKSLKKGIEAMDNPNLIGVVLNDASDSESGYYQDRYYAPPPQDKQQS